MEVQYECIRQLPQNKSLVAVVLRTVCQGGDAKAVRDLDGHIEKVDLALLTIAEFRLKVRNHDTHESMKIIVKMRDAVCEVSVHHLDVFSHTT